MKPLISESLKSALVEQIGAEKENANIYLCLASFLNGKGLSNLAKKFETQHQEETEHSLIIYKLLVDLGVVFGIPEINSCNLSFSKISELANLYLEREILTTESLNDIKSQAIDEGNPVVEERMREMIKLQQAEYEEATDFLDKALLIQDDWKFVLMWDLGEG